MRIFVSEPIELGPLISHCRPLLSSLLTAFRLKFSVIELPECRIEIGLVAIFVYQIFLLWFGSVLFKEDLGFDKHLARRVVLRRLQPNIQIFYWF